MKPTDALALRPNRTLLWPAATVGCLLALLAAVGPVLRVEHLLSWYRAWGAWPLTPSITLGILAGALLYIAGQQEVTEHDNNAGLRHLAFFGGLAALFLALQSPIKQLSDHLFFVHQVEHMLLRTTAPMLLVLAAPQAALLRGTPSWLRRSVAGPIVDNPVMRALGALGRPAVATILFVGMTCFWLIPRFHDAAVLDQRVHYLWCATLVISGLVFFRCILDPRLYPHGASLGVRLFMFWIASIGNILLGSYLTFKPQLLYHAYGEMGRLWGISAATDQALGGLTMWIPGSMMFVATAMLMIYRWAQQEERSLAVSGAGTGLQAATAVEFVGQRRAANRKMAIGLVCFMLTVAAITFTTVLFYHHGGEAGGLADF